MVFGKELSGQISFAAAEFYAKDFLKAGHRHFCRCPVFSWHRFWVLRFCSTAFCRCHFYFYGFLTNACLSAFRRLPFCFFDTLFHTAQLCRSRFVPWRFSRPPDMGRFQRSRWTSDGHFSGRICTAGQRVKRPVWTRRTGGESTPTVADEGDGGLTNFSQHYIIFIAAKSHIIWLAKRK